MRNWKRINAKDLFNSKGLSRFQVKCQPCFSVIPLIVVWHPEASLLMWFSAISIVIGLNTYPSGNLLHSALFRLFSTCYVIHCHTSELIPACSNDFLLTVTLKPFPLLEVYSQGLDFLCYNAWFSEQVSKQFGRIEKT